VNVLVTGAAGFIGSNLVKQLSSFTDVRGIDDLSTGYLRNLDGLDVDFVEGSILDETVLSKMMSGCDAIVHLAARPSVPRSIAKSDKASETCRDTNGSSAISGCGKRADSACNY